LTDPDHTRTRPAGLPGPRDKAVTTAMRARHCACYPGILHTSERRPAARAVMQQIRFFNGPVAHIQLTSVNVLINIVLAKNTIQQNIFEYIHFDTNTIWFLSAALNMNTARIRYNMIWI